MIIRLTNARSALTSLFLSLVKQIGNGSM